MHEHDEESERPPNAPRPSIIIHARERPSDRHFAQSWVRVFPASAAKKFGFAVRDAARDHAAMRDRMPTPFSRTSLSMSFKKKNAMAQSSKDESSPLFADVPSVGGDKTSSMPSATGASHRHSEAQKLVRATSSLDEALAPEQAPLGSGVDSRP